MPSICETTAGGRTVFPVETNRHGPLVVRQRVFRTVPVRPQAATRHGVEHRGLADGAVREQPRQAGRADHMSRDVTAVVDDELGIELATRDTDLDVVFGRIRRQGNLRAGRPSDEADPQARQDCPERYCSGDSHR